MNNILIKLKSIDLLSSVVLMNSERFTVSFIQVMICIEIQRELPIEILSH